MEDVRWKQRFVNFKKALEQFRAAVDCHPKDRLAQEGLIQRFEYTFELAWKCLQDLLQERGYADVRGPRPVIEQAYQDGLVQDGLVWMEMLKARNEASHIYDEAIFQRIYQRASEVFLGALNGLKVTLEKL